MKEYKLYLWIFIDFEFRLLSYKKLDKHNFSVSKIFTPKFYIEIFSLNEILGDNFKQIK